MKKSIQLLSVAAIILSACNNNESPKETTVTSTTNADSVTAITETKVTAPSKMCYAFTGKDTATLSLVVNENNVMGDLMYKIAGKDKNTGAFTGTMMGDTLLGDYKFMSEGKESTRQVAFLVKDNMAVEGYGASEEKNGKMVFKNTGSLNFGKGISMTKTDCKN